MDSPIYDAVIADAENRKQYVDEENRIHWLTDKEIAERENGG